MSGNFDSEQWQNFNDRLSHWISKQGFWFQLRHSLPRAGQTGVFMVHFVNLILRLGLFLLITGIIYTYVVKLTGEEKFKENLTKEFHEKFSAKEVEIGSVNRGRGKFIIARLGMIDDQNSFFRALELSNLACNRDFFVDFGKTWKPGIVEISKVNILLRAGADTDESAGKIGDVLFQDLGNLKPDAIHVLNMSLKWGYTERSSGSIDGSKMKAVPVSDGWRLSFRGGSFSQNWLKKLQIEELDVLITRKGIQFEKAVFSKNGGTLVLNQLEIEAGHRPLVSGQMKMKGLDISSMVPLVARAYVEGKISGDFDVSGSTNSSDGIGIDGVVKLEEGDVITLRDKVPLLRALSVVDSSSAYHRVDFRTGSFQLEMLGKGLEISDAKLFADNTMSLSGEMLVRKPKSDEELALDDGSEFFGNIIIDDQLSGDLDLSLPEAEEIINRNNKKMQTNEDYSLFEKLSTIRESRLVRQFESERLSRSYRYEGNFNLTLMSTVFDRAPELKKTFPAISETGRIPITVPIKGLLYEVTDDIANTLYEKGWR